MNDNDSLQFKPETETQSKSSPNSESWTVLIVDDDPDMHAMTGFILRDIVFQDQGLTLLHAKSGVEARLLLQSTPDVAVALIDVVMETDRAGLDLVRYIRRELVNNAMAIILRTGYPGAIPERSVIFDFEINDYKSKAELTAERLVTSVVAGLRYNSMYRQLVESRDNEVDALITVYQARRDALEQQARRDAERHVELCAIADTLEMETLSRLSHCLKELGEIMWPSRMELKQEMSHREFERLIGQLDGLARMLEDLRMANRSIIAIVRTA